MKAAKCGDHQSGVRDQCAKSNAMREMQWNWAKMQWMATKCVEIRGNEEERVEAREGVRERGGEGGRGCGHK